MRTMQQKFEARIEEMIIEAKLDAVVSRNFVNTGDIYAQSGSKTILRLGFHFDTESVAFVINGQRRYVNYTAEADIEKFWNELRTLLKSAAPAPTRR